MNFCCTQHSSSKLGSAFVCTKFLIFSIFLWSGFALEIEFKIKFKITPE